MKLHRLIPAAVLAVAALASTACATGYAYGDRRPYVYGDRGYYAGADRIAYDNGFRRGIRDGERDSRGNHRFDPRRHGGWRDADNGYRREYGDHNFYRRNFRSGYEAGYAQGFRRSDGGRYRRW
jgi:hypothetical protein